MPDLLGPLQEVRLNHYIYGQDGRVQQFAFLPEDVIEEAVSHMLPSAPKQTMLLSELHIPTWTEHRSVVCLVVPGRCILPVATERACCTSHFCWATAEGDAARLVMPGLGWRRWPFPTLEAVLFRKQVALQRLRP